MLNLVHGGNKRFHLLYNYHYTDQNSTSFQIDTTAPIIINCPSDISESLETGSSFLPSSWMVPSALDLQDGKVTTRLYASHNPGDIFYVGTTTNVSYAFRDEAGNVATCNFSVTVSQGMGESI